MFSNGLIPRLALAVAFAGAVPGVTAPLGAAPLPTTPAPAVTPPLTGIVVDSAGAPMANVDVIATELGRATVTGSDGRFVFRALPPGTLHLSVLHPGHAPAHVVVTIPADGANPVTVRVVLRRSVLRLQSVQVTASPTGTDPLSITQSTIQVAGRDLQGAQAMSIAQVLAAEPGMAMRFNGPMANVPVIRGLTGERILVLQDGDRVGDVSAAAADHAVAIDPASAERVEVIRGPASLLYGNNALGGVVNVISNDIPTSVPARTTGTVLVQGESVNPGGVLNAGATTALGGGLALTARGGVRRMADYRTGGGIVQDNTDARRADGVVGLGWTGNAASIGVAVRTQDFAYGLPFAPGDAPTRIDGTRHNVQLRGGLATGWIPVGYVRVDGGATWYRHGEIEPDGTVGTRFALTTQTLNVTGRTAFGPLRGAIGVQGLRRRYTPTGDEAFTPPADNDNVAVFAYQELPLGAGATEARTPRLQAGARWDRWTVATRAAEARFGGPASRAFGNASGSIGAALPFGRIWSLSGSVARAFRAPTVEELYANGFHAAVGTFDVGNASLVAETSTGGEAILRAQGTRFHVQLSTWRTAIADYVLPVAVRDTVIDGDAVPFVNFSQRDARLAGAELSGELQLARHLVLGATGDLTRGTLAGGGVLPYIPAARLGASARWDTGRWSLGGDVRRAFAQDRVAATNPAAIRDLRDVAVRGYTLVNLAATWTLSRGTTLQALTLRVDNLLDERFADATSRIKSFTFNPGRNIALAWRIQY